MLYQTGCVEACTPAALACNRLSVDLWQASWLHASNPCYHQVGWSFNSTELRQALSSSTFLTDLTIALGAQIGNHDLQLLATSCPHLEHLTLAFQHISDAGQLTQLACFAATQPTSQEDCH